MADDPFASYLPEGSLSLGFIACVKVLEPDGSLAIHHIFSDDVTSWERLGMATSLLDSLRDRMRDAYEEVAFEDGDDAGED